MKRLLTIMLALILLSASDSGASYARGRAEWGFKIGMDLDNHDYSTRSGPGYSADNRVGLAVGVFLTRYVSSRVATQTELYYAIRGLTERRWSGYGDNRYTSEKKVRIDCLELSWLWKFFIGSGTPQPNLYIGPDIAAFVYCRQEYQSEHYRNGILEHSYSSSSSGGGGWDRWGDVGLIVGGGLDFPVGKDKVLVDARCF
ncbi:hypothetical protein AMJ86_08065, partial [bacterium SM23_57]